jgi:hypothetical protein
MALLTKALCQLYPIADVLLFSEKLAPLLPLAAHQEVAWKISVCRLVLLALSGSAEEADAALLESRRLRVSRSLTTRSLELTERLMQAGEKIIDLRAGLGGAPVASVTKVLRGQIVDEKGVVRTILKLKVEGTGIPLLDPRSPAVRLTRLSGRWTVRSEGTALALYDAGVPRCILWMPAWVGSWGVLAAPTASRDDAVVHRALHAPLGPPDVVVVGDDEDQMLVSLTAADLMPLQ